MDLLPLTLKELRRIADSISPDYDDCTVGFACLSEKTEDGMVEVRMVPVTLAVVHPDRTNVLLCDKQSGEFLTQRAKAENIKRV